nr:hypothetical protein [Nitrosomonas nitrosa]
MHAPEGRRQIRREFRRISDICSLRGIRLQETIAQKADRGSHFLEAGGAAVNGPESAEGLWVAHEPKEGGIQPHLQPHYSIRLHGDHCFRVSGGRSRRDDHVDSVEVFPLKPEAHRRISRISLGNRSSPIFCTRHQPAAQGPDARRQKTRVSGFRSLKGDRRIGDFYP